MSKSEIIVFLVVWLKVKILLKKSLDGTLLYFELIQRNYPAGNYIFKVNNRNTRARCEICSIANGIVLVSLLLTLNIFSHLVLVFLFLTLSR